MTAVIFIILFGSILLMLGPSRDDEALGRDLADALFGDDDD